MARIVITRPNGETEYAELTTDKAQAGNDRLAVEKDGTTYYAKLDSGVSTHMFVIKSEGRKLYVQKEVKFVWEYTFDGTDTTLFKMVIPRTGQYRIRYGGRSISVRLKKGGKFIRNKEGQPYIEGWAYGYASRYYKWQEFRVGRDNYSSYEISSIEYIGEA
jgi:hypothetical protein